MEKTFINLKEDRKEEILLCAYKEFALKGYEAASLSEIIKKLNLAKGSFYRYFKNKKALYQYLITDSTERRLSELNELIENGKPDFFRLIRKNFISKVKFDLENPVIAGFLYRVMIEKNNNEVRDIVNSLYNEIIQRTESIISTPEIKEQLVNIDSKLIAYQVFHTQLWLYEFVAQKFNLNYESNIEHNKPILDLSDNELGSTIDNVIELMRNGISNQK